MPPPPPKPPPPPLESTLLPSPPPLLPPQPLDRLCATGLKDANNGNAVCCAKECGACGVPHCSVILPDKLESMGKCCTRRIIKNQRACKSPTDSGCVLDNSIQTIGTELHAAIGATEHSFRTCAVVGSSGSMLLGRFGEEIDRHDAVIRFNSAPVEGFAPIVGSKTTFRLMNSQAMAKVIKRCSPPGKCVSNTTCCGHLGERIIVNSGQPVVSKCYRRVCGRPALRIDQFMKTVPLQAHPFLANAPKGRKGASILSGIYGLVVATALCGNGSVDAYGFTSSTSSRPRYHYYDACPHARTDPIWTTAAAFQTGWLPRMNQRFNTRMRFREPSVQGTAWTGSLSSSNCPLETDAFSFQFSQLSKTAPSLTTANDMKMARGKPTLPNNWAAAKNRSYMKDTSDPRSVAGQRVVVRLRGRAEFERKCKENFGVSGAPGAKMVANTQYVISLMNQIDAYMNSDLNKAHELLVTASRILAQGLK